MDWQQVDDGWGRRAPEFAYRFETMPWCEYVHLLKRTNVRAGDRALQEARRVGCPGGASG